MKITKKPLDSLRTNYTGSKFGPYKVIKYVHHLRTSPQWLVECEFCKNRNTLGITAIKKIKSCECEELLKWRSKVFISNSIFVEYIKKSKREKSKFDLDITALYKIYNRQNGKDEYGNKLIFEFGPNYSGDVPKTDYIWPDLLRKNEKLGYSLTNCYFMANLKQRYSQARNVRKRKMK